MSGGASRRIWVSALLTASLAALPPAFSQATFQPVKPEEAVGSILSLKQFKRQMRTLFSRRNDCQDAPCLNAIGTQICEALGALDVRIAGQLTGQPTGGTNLPTLSIAQGDLSLMRLIYSQCRPTNAQYWQFASVLHVSYQPQPAIDSQVQRAFGLR
ncbi:hypothetical protein [Gloeobacter kilaueensis]|uniref:DUF4168 domain-containing protein n=1 Tax=Gloeobacter kilaueensis (strain ATCC BAA-2537 / CCAP 1431/1 / ULC 316 / JS1) TaxID=1183438 RepID=U5QHT8_GLOK1|nr:hypothetical protein [Gloeobacter kilaueensis]AGY58542.1 hypothetical protein GKIL_2296 [Gloeobacter kilaueensis JS1]